MFTAYFDASGSENDQLCLAVAGFVAADQDWVTFERQWLTRLAEDGLQRFHRKELQAWEREKRTKLINDLIELIAGTVARKFGAVVQNDSLSLLSADERRKWHIRPYSLAGRVCGAHIRQWSTRDRIGYVPNLIFADGDLGKGDLIALLEESQFAVPVFKPSHNTVLGNGQAVLGAVPLQAADLFAYELFGPQRHILRDGYITEIPKTYTRLDNIPGELGIVDKEYVQRLPKDLAEIEAIRRSKPGEIFIAKTAIPSRREV